MCVDDYQFRHFSAIKPKQCRRFIFVNQDDIQKTFLVNISQFQEDGQVALCKIINHLSLKGLLANKRSFFWPKFNMTIKYGENCKVPFQALQEKQIIFKALIVGENQENYKIWQSFRNESCIQVEVFQKKEETDDGLIDNKMFQQLDQCKNYHSIQDKEQEQDQQYIPQVSTHHNNQQPRSPQTDVLQRNISEKCLKRKKQSQRTILQVLTALKKWRKLYENKKMNLKKAANMIGISKKSLDDYYLVVRIGEVLKFDFQSHLSGKMGDLRSFIKKFENKVTGKLTKHVKCFCLLPDFDLDSLIKAYEQFSKQVTESVEDQ